MIYVDDAAMLYKGKLRYHMTADSLSELHDFAAQIGVKRCWYHKPKVHPHYDVTREQREDAIQHGATIVDSRTILQVARGLVHRPK
jgi:hypothetical protein